MDNNGHPMFRPKWVRALVIAIPGAVGLWDAYNERWGWALIFLGLAGYGLYVFFVSWQDPEDRPKAPSSDDNTDSDQS